VRLDTVAKVVRGVSYAKGDVIQAPGNGDIPVLRAGNINGQLILDHDLVWLSKSLVSQDQLLRCNDIVMCMSSGSASIVGKSALLDRDWIGSFGAFCAAVRPNATKTEPGYLAHVFQSAGYRKWASAAQGNNIKNLNKSALEAYTFPLPPLQEQRGIVGLLDRAAEIRRRANAARAKARAIIPALFLDIFGDPATNLKGWPVVKVADAGEVRLGRQRAPKYQTGKFTRPYVRVANVFENLIDVSDLLSMDFDGSDFATYRLRYGDILLNEGQSIELVGRPAMWRDEVSDCCFQNTLVRFRCDPAHTTPEFALTAFLWMYHSGQFTQIASKTSNIAHLGAGRFAKLPMVLPPLPLQIAFAEQAQRVEATTRALDAVAAKAEAMAAALSAEVFGAPPGKGPGNGA
jgi:type I restriction enzyme S subunit